MKCLVVDDLPDKRAAIAKVLLRVDGIQSEDLHFAGDAATARMLLRQQSFDLLVLDVVLPASMDVVASANEGGLLLEELLAHPDRYHIPAHIVGITAYETALERFASEFSSRLLTLVRFDETSEEWEAQIEARARHIVISAGGTGVTASTAYDIGIICALATVELRAVRDLPWHWQQQRVERDHQIYYTGGFDKGGIRRRCVCAAVGRAGLPSAAILSTKMIELFRPKLLILCGITAAIPGRAEYGDVIVGNPVWDWGSGKWIVEAGERRFLPGAYQLRLDPHVRERLRLLAEDADILTSIRADWRGEAPRPSPAIIFGPLASGAAVLADGRTAKQIADEQHRDIVAIEMEAYAVLAAADEAREPRPLAVVVKSVADFADGSKADRYHAYASYTSAQVARHLAESIA